jgi:hypothetical protein
VSGKIFIVYTICHHDPPTVEVSSSDFFFCATPHFYQTSVSVRTSHGSCLPTSSVIVSSLMAFIPSAAIKPTPPFRDNASSVLPLHQGKKDPLTKGIKTSQITRIELAKAVRTCVRSGSGLRRTIMLAQTPKYANIPHRDAMIGIALYAPATPPGTCFKNSSGNFLPSSFVSAVEPSNRTICRYVTSRVL